MKVIVNVLYQVILRYWNDVSYFPSCWYLGLNDRRVKVDAKGVASSAAMIVLLEADIWFDGDYVPWITIALTIA